MFSFPNSKLIEYDETDEIGLEEFPDNAALDVDNYIVGIGDNQDVRIYVNNKSENLNDNQNYFEIPSVTSDDMYLTYGDFNFTFQNNFTTEYILEDDDAAYAEDFISFDYDTDLSGISYHSDTQLLDGDFGDLTDGDNFTNIYLNATLGILNFTIRADFTDTTYTTIDINGNIEFNRSKILLLIYSLVCRIYLDANLTVRLKDYTQPTWNELISSVPVYSGVGIQELSEHLINENLNYIDLTDTTFIEFVFERDDLNPFTARLYEFDMKSTYAFDLPITDQNYVALEFDLKGEKSTVNGFSAWIRTLNLTKAATSQLNISIYRANDTVVRTDDNLRSIEINPDYNDLIDSKLMSYTNDQLSYFEFNTGSLNLSNYFIVIKSTNSEEVYSLVTLPFFDYGDDFRTEHQLLTTTDNGINWNFAKRIIETDNPPWTYASGQLDASSFKLNVTRGYMPSDFTYNDNNTLRIQDIPINNLEVKTYPYNISSYLTWGIGRWTNDFPTVIEDSPLNEFQINLNWNKSIIEGFEFNVSYSINAYWVEDATAYYNVTYNENPEWALNFDFDKGNPNFNNWEFLEFWYIYPNFMSAHNLTKPNDEEFLWLLEDESIVEDSPSKLKLVVNETFSAFGGIYTLNLTSFNFIDEMHTYINYYGTLWETNGFMYGDNISVSVDIQDQYSRAPISGEANATLFYPNGTRYPVADLNSLSGVIDNSKLIYDFNNITILDVTKSLTSFGRYNLGFFWFNGSAIGCKKILLYIDVYDLELYNCTYLSDLNTNALIGELKNKVFDNYTMLIASINDTTGISLPDFYPINKSDLNEEYTYELGGQEITLVINSFLQSENILNPNEVVNFKTTIQNTHPFIPVEATINVKLVSFINEDLIIADTTAPIINLNFSGAPDDTYEFDVDLPIPDINVVTSTWEGVNGPVRLGGAKTIITLLIDGHEVGVFESTDYSLLSNETSNDFEGYILGLTLTEQNPSRSILYEFERDQCLYFPDETTFLVNIIDKNYVSSYKQFDGKFSLSLNSIFTNVAITPEFPRTGEIINVSSILATEFGVELIGKNVTCDYYNTDSWVNIGSEFTDVNGSVAFSINTGIIDIEENLKVRLSWDGDTINGVSKNITIELIQEFNNFSISIIQNDRTIYQSKSTTLKITIINFGDSNLRFFNISIDLEGDLPSSIVGINYVELNWLEPDESTEIIIEIEVPQIEILEITFSITAQNILTGENITGSEHASFKVFDPSVLDYFLELFMYIIFAIFALIWIIAIVYALKVRKRIAEPIEEVERRPRKGRYVLVPDLKKPEPPKAAVKKAPKKKDEVTSEKTTDLDALLEERGLTEKQKKKKPKK
ncbi:MAG: hypothetical protein ACFFA0_15735 [Promethearchaeota archaeon]